MKNLSFKSSIAFAVLSCAMSLASAQSSTSGQSQAAESAATNQGVSNSTSIVNQAQSPYTQSQIDQKFHTNQASSAPAVIGSTAPSSGGCPAVEGWSASIVVANGGKSSAVELPGCMANQLADRIGRLTTEKDGSWSWASIMQLEAWCSFSQYKVILERSRKYECAETTEAKKNNAVKAAVVLPPGIPASYANANLSDPSILARAQAAGAVR